jgi:hypothetical protein
MKTMIAAVVHWLLVFSIFWPLGCSLTQPPIPEDKLPPPPVPRKIEQPPEIQPEPAAPPSTPEVKFFTHQIKWPGENLIRISRWYTGSGQNWLNIVEANPSIDPRRIKIGDTILIPENLLKTREPMPISYIAPRVEKKNEPSSPSAVPPPNSNEVELFGPIDTETPAERFDGTGTPLPLETIE